MIHSCTSWPRALSGDRDYGFAQARPGLESWAARDETPLHRHADAYAALVLSGSYEEIGSNGRLQVSAGQVLLHRRFDAHFNRFGRTGARLLNLPLKADIGSPLAAVDDPDALARMAEIDRQGASELLPQLLRPAAVELSDWPDLLAQDLIADPAMRLDWWARERGFAPATISRGFRKVFGVSAVAFRAEVRAQRAFRQIVQANVSLAWVAADACFADQAHMSRAIKAMTGRPPGWWLRSNRFKNERRMPSQDARA